MSPRALLSVGVGLLVTGLLIVLAIDTDPATGPDPGAVLVQDYVSNACALVGAGLVVAAALVSALRRRTPVEPPSIDHYA